MTGFRQIENLHAYSGGTVRDLHPVFYSPVGLLPHPQALKRNIYLQHQYIRLHFKCQSEKRKSQQNKKFAASQLTSTLVLVAFDLSNPVLLKPKHM